MNKASFHLSYWLALAGASGVALVPAQADQVKADNNSTLESGGSRVSDVAPAENEVAIWNSTVASAANCTGGNGNMGISFPTQPGYSYQVEYKTNLTDVAWIPLGSTVSGDGTIHSLNYPAADDSRFCGIQIQ